MNSGVTIEGHTQCCSPDVVTVACQSRYTYLWSSQRMRQYTVRETNSCHLNASDMSYSHVAMFQ